MRRLHIDVGEKFGWLTVVKVLQGPPRYRCRCECGALVVRLGYPLRSGRAVSCGCKKTARLVAFNTKHGAAPRSGATPEFKAWCAMRERCTNPKHRAWKHYGGRGITVCVRWQRFENFLADMGPRPTARHSLDRRNNEWGYQPSNCHWATKKQQSQNRRNVTRRA